MPKTTKTVDWVSPLRPDRTDIAEYTRRVRNALSGSAVDLRTIGTGSAMRMAAYTRQLPPFFNIGNDGRFHGNILQACRTMGGIVVAHDYRIQHLIASHLDAGEDGWEARYISAMAATYGAEGQAAAIAHIAGRLSLQDLAVDFPGIEYAAHNALCVITHNGALADEIATRTGLYCGVLPLPFPVIGDGETSARPAASTDPGALIDLLAFGYLGENRQVGTICDVLEKLDQGSRFRLNIAGSPVPSVQRRIDDFAAAGGNVVVHGFMAEDALDALIGRVHLVLNLRHPTMGEVSGSQLRIFANAGLSVVVDTGWYAGGLPDDTVIKLDAHNLKQELTALLLTFEREAGRPEAFAGHARRGFEHVSRHHSAAAFRVAFERFMDELPKALAHGRRMDVAGRLKRAHGAMGADWDGLDATLLEKARQLL